jgi:hypothetical protein
MERAGDWESRVRVISSRGRLSSTIWKRQIALSEDGTTYELVADVDQPQTVDERRRLQLLQDTPDGLTRAEFEAVAELSKSTAHRTLAEFVQKGHATVHDGPPPRYFAVIPANEPQI